MKILYIISTGILGGIERHVQCLAKCLNELRRLGPAAFSWHSARLDGLGKSGEMRLAQGENIVQSSEFRVSSESGDNLATNHSPLAIDDIEVKVLILGQEGPIGKAMRADGIDVEVFGCRNGHDLRIFSKLRHLLKTWKPDVVCPQMPMLFPMIYFNLVDRKSPLICSIHTPTKMHSRIVRFVENIVARRYNYFLPVSSSTWDEYCSVYPWAKGRGEVFYNPLYRPAGVVESRKLKVESVDGEGNNLQPSTFNLQLSSHSFVVGMVGRAADQKDWPSFAEVAAKVTSTFNLQPSTSKLVFVGVGATRDEAASLPGMKTENLEAVEWKGRQSNGREWIRKFDLFVMTSKHEQLPTTVLECFAEDTPICGFLPDGGTTDILQYSGGPVNDCFIKERDCGKLAEIIGRIIKCADLRNSLVEDGRQILDGHFDAITNCRGQLLEVYSRVAGINVEG